ncbi:MAG TPA: peptidase M28, partial [Sphingomicrobium sp.]|nr:peptidase M28 [Sphingomicrobium sp.]
SYAIHWRRTDANQWEISRSVPASQCSTECKMVLPHVRIDDWVFGVASVSKDGFESPVASAVPGGAFKPYVAPPPKPKS